MQVLWKRLVNLTKNQKNVLIAGKNLINVSEIPAYSNWQTVCTLNNQHEQLLYALQVMEDEADYANRQTLKSPETGL